MRIFQQLNLNKFTTIPFLHHKALLCVKLKQLITIKENLVQPRPCLQAGRKTSKSVPNSEYSFNLAFQTMPILFKSLVFDQDGGPNCYQCSWIEYFTLPALREGISKQDLGAGFLKGTRHEGQQVQHVNGNQIHERGARCDCQPTASLISDCN